MGGIACADFLKNRCWGGLVPLEPFLAHFHALRHATRAVWHALRRTRARPSKRRFVLSNVLFAYLDLGFVHGVFRDCDEQRLVERSGSALSVSVSVSLLYLSHFPAISLLSSLVERSGGTGLGTAAGHLGGAAVGQARAHSGQRQVRVLFFLVYLFLRRGGVVGARGRLSVW